MKKSMTLTSSRQMVMVLHKTSDQYQDQRVLLIPRSLNSSLLLFIDKRPK